MDKSTGTTSHHLDIPPQQGCECGGRLQQQQQQQVVVVDAAQLKPAVTGQRQQRVASYTGHIIFAWCCNPLFGFFAFLLAS